MFIDNQTFVDDLKDKYGYPHPFFDSLKLYLGIDTKWWLIPTYPRIRVNYLERMYDWTEINKWEKIEPEITREIQYDTTCKSKILSDK